MPETMSLSPLSANGVDFNNKTQAMDFLGSLLDDTVLKTISNRYAVILWIGIFCTIVVVATGHLVDWVVGQLRKRRRAKGQKTSIFTPGNMVITPIRKLRALTYLQFSPSMWSSWIKVPPLGTVVLLLSYLGFVLILEFVHNDVHGEQRIQAKGVRAGWLAVAQMPLIILLVGKKNWISLLTGVSYERLNVLHRWVARVMLLMAVFHLAFQVEAWKKYPGIFQLEWTTDFCIPTGLAAFVLLFWINISTLAPFRNLCYEFFVVQHILTFFGFTIAIMIHLPTTALYSRIYVYIPIGFYLLDRIVRTAYYAYVNRTANNATLTRLPGGVTEIRTKCKTDKTWQPGSHMLISFPGLGFGQSHPATIASGPESHGGDLVFYLKSHGGFTKTLYERAFSKLDGVQNGEVRHSQKQHRILLDGPYGGQQVDFAAYDSICLIAGSTGITFVLSILLGLTSAAGASGGKLPMRFVHVVWAVKERSHLEWVQADLGVAIEELRKVGIEAKMSFFITATDLTADPEQSTEKTTNLGWSRTRMAHRAPEACVQLGRPQIGPIVEESFNLADGQLGIAVCGPLQMNMDVRKAVAGLVLGQHLTKDGQKPGVFLHVEGFAY